MHLGSRGRASYGRRVCRLFGMSAAPHRDRATFWLLDAEDGLAAQSHREPDGTGLGAFSARGVPIVSKQPVAAFEDATFAREARTLVSSTFIAHIRFASTGAVERRNTHPFEQRGRLLAHNGVIGGLDRLEAELADDRDLVVGDTDSERFFALVTRRIDQHAGDVGAGLTEAARFVAANLPLYALNIVLVTPTDLWALRYPETHELLYLERDPGKNARQLDHSGQTGTIRVRSLDAARHPAVVVASERMDEDPGWRALGSGDLLHVDHALGVRVERILEGPPAHPLSLSDLGAHAAASQQAVT
jgi:predicted glutamine amidotransferase